MLMSLVLVLDQMMTHIVWHVVSLLVCGRSTDNTNLVCGLRYLFSPPVNSTIFSPHSPGPSCTLRREFYMSHTRSSHRELSTAHMLCLTACACKKHVHKLVDHDPRALTQGTWFSKQTSDYIDLLFVEWPMQRRGPWPVATAVEKLNSG